MVITVPFFLTIKSPKEYLYLKEYLKAQTKTTDAIVSNVFSTDERERFSKSDHRWIDNKSKHYRHRTVKKGEIYQFEFGKNFQPEMSYEHRGLVIGVKQKLLYVLPIFSYNPAKHLDIYHPTDFPDSKSDLFLLKSADFSFIAHDSVLKLNDLRTVSINRILYQQHGIISLTSDTYTKIEELVIQKYFPSFRYKYIQTQQKLSELEAALAEKENELHLLCIENKELKKQIENFPNLSI